MNRTTRKFAVALAAALTATLAVVLGPPAPAAAEVDVYTTPGEHLVNGRRWKTECQQYSTTVERCRTEAPELREFGKGRLVRCHRAEELNLVGAVPDARLEGVS